MKNHEIREALRLLEQQYQYVNRMEVIHFDMIKRGFYEEISEILDFSRGTIIDQDRFHAKKFENLIVVLVKLMDEKEMVYRYTLNLSDDLISNITEELEN